MDRIADLEKAEREGGGGGVDGRRTLDRRGDRGSEIGDRAVCAFRAKGEKMRLGKEAGDGAGYL
jgi:hypothetical protein